MKKHLRKSLIFLALVFFFIACTAYSQNAENPVPLLDKAVNTLAGEINGKLVAEKANAIEVGQFTYNGSIAPLGTYLTNQLTEDFANISNKPYSVISGRPADTQWTISGEIVEVAGIIRVYTRLVRTQNRSIEAAFHSDFEHNQALARMMIIRESRGGSGSSSAPIDDWEPDSWENPVTYEIGVGEDTATMNRTIHNGEDEDFFLLVPDRSARLIVETTGDIDTYMYLYNYDDQEQIGEDDDGGQGANARIRRNVRAGTRYLAKVKGYGSSTAGNYGFKAYYLEGDASLSSWEVPVTYEIGSGNNARILSRTLNESEDEDYFLLVPERDGRLTVETTDNEFDTYMYFYNYDTKELIAEDDDGGSGTNARIRYDVRAGVRYLARVIGYGGETGGFGFRAYID